MRVSRSCFLAASAAQAVYACQREQRHEFHAHKALEKRQVTDFPPQPTAEESVLLNSFDNTTIEQW